MKQATMRINTSRSLPIGYVDKRSNLSIVRDSNEFGSNIHVKTASMMVREGWIEISSKKTVPVGIIDTQHWNFMKNACMSFLKLEQAYKKKKLNMKVMALNVNTCLNRSGLNRNDQYCVRKIRTDTADRMEVEYN